MTRWKAAGLHLLLSVIVVSAVGLGLILVWYGWDLFTTMGAAKLLTILALVDVVIGPLLTLIVYKVGKPSLRFDLTVIALLQLGFLAYGMHVMWQTRPVFLVGVLDRFELVFANDLPDEAMQRAPAFRKSANGPQTVGGKLAQTSEETYELAMASASGMDIQHMPDRYVPYEEIAGTILASAKPVRELIEAAPGQERTLQSRLERLGRDADSVAYVPIISRRGRATMLLDAQTGDILGPLAIDPWPDLAAQEK